MKLKYKERVGAKIVKTYDEPKTPYQRLLVSLNLSQDQKDPLKQHMAGLNPFHLKKELDSKLKIFFELVDHLKRLDATHSDP